jgi:hypothetical protein
MDRHPERKDGTAVSARKNILHMNVDLTPLGSVEETEV